MALGSTQPLTEMSTRNLPGGKGRPAHEADKLTAICEPIVKKMWEPRLLTNLWAFTACCKDSLPYILPYVESIVLKVVANVVTGTKNEKKDVNSSELRKSVVTLTFELSDKWIMYE
jgi:hypothetical protein